MNVTKEDLSMFTTAVAEIRAEGFIEGLAEAKAEGLTKVLTPSVVNLRQQMALSDEQIANITGTTVEFVSSIIDKYDQKEALIAST